MSASKTHFGKCMDIGSLSELHKLARQDATKYPAYRELFNTTLKQKSERHFTGIVGPRGVWKTVLFKQLAADNPNAFYLSLDTLPCDENVFSIIKKLSLNHRYHFSLLDLCQSIIKRGLLKNVIKTYFKEIFVFSLRDEIVFVVFTMNTTAIIGMTSPKFSPNTTYVRTSPEMIDHLNI